MLSRTAVHKLIKARRLSVLSCSRCWTNREASDILSLPVTPNRGISFYCILSMTLSGCSRKGCKFSVLD
jgi:hypothetical protein